MFTTKKIYELVYITKLRSSNVTIKVNLLYKKEKDARKDLKNFYSVGTEKGSGTIICSDVYTRDLF